MAYLDPLTDNQVEALEMVLDDLKSGSTKTSISIKDIFEEAPVLTKTSILFRYYKTSNFQGNNTPGELYNFEDNGYMLVSAVPLAGKSGATTLAFVLPAETPIVPVDGDLFLIKGGTVYYTPDGDDEWTATIKESALTASARPMPMMFFNGGPVPERCEECGMSPIQEFYNRCHSGQDGKFCGNRSGRNRGGGRPGGGQQQGGPRSSGGRPGGGGRPGPGGGKPKQTKAEIRAQRYRNILGAATATIGVLAVIAGAINAIGTIDQSRGAKRQAEREALLERERNRRKGGGLDAQDRRVSDWMKSKPKYTRPPEENFVRPSSRKRREGTGFGSARMFKYGEGFPQRANNFTEPAPRQGPQGEDAA